MTKRLSPRQVFNFASRIIDARNVVGNRLEILCPNNLDFHALYYSLPNENIYLMHPACDFDRILLSQGNAGTIPLPEVLKHVAHLQMSKPFGESDTFFIPLAECRKRAHWTFLTIKGGEAHFYDPRSSLPYPFASFQYSLKPIKDYLSALGYKLPADNVTYLGLQPLLDDQYCGYFVGYAIQSLATHKSVKSIKPITIAEVEEEYLASASMKKNKFKYSAQIEPLNVVDRFKENAERQDLSPSRDHVVVCSTPIPPKVDEEKWIPIEYSTFAEATAATSLTQPESTLVSIELGPQKEKFAEIEPLTPITNEPLNTLPDITSHPGLSYALKAKEDQFLALISDKKYWKSKSHFSYKIPQGLQLMQDKSFDEAKKIAHLQMHKKKSWFQFFTCYDSRDYITHQLYKALNTETSLYDLFVNTSFNEVLKDYADWQSKNTLASSASRIMS